MPIQIRSKQARLFLSIAMVCAIVALVFAALWVFARNDKSDLARTAQDEATVCRDAWGIFAESGKEADAARALASLYAFSRDMEPLVAGSSRDAYPSYCMEVFRLLTEQPELCAPYAAELKKQMGFLAGDIYRVSAYFEFYKMAERMQRGELPKAGTETGTGSDTESGTTDGCLPGEGVWMVCMNM